MMNHTFTYSALLLAAVPVVLTSCSKKSPEEQMIDVMREITAVYEQTTPHNAEAMLKKLAALDILAKEAVKAQREEPITDPARQQKILGVFTKMVEAAGKLDAKCKTLPEAEQAQVRKVLIESGRILSGK